MFLGRLHIFSPVSLRKVRAAHNGPQEATGILLLYFEF
jgi:hypothetical protein